MQVRVRNTQYGRAGVWQFSQPEFFDYEGEEVVDMRGVTADELALTTGDPEWPVRVIQRRWIVAIDGRAFTAQETQQETKIVKGSKGQEYVVTHSRGQWHCTCPGFQFRKTCKHTQA